MVLIIILVEYTPKSDSDPNFDNYPNDYRYYPGGLLIIIMALLLETQLPLLTFVGPIHDTRALSGGARTAHREL